MSACFISGCTQAEIVPRTDNGEERARVLQRVRARQNDLHRHRGTLSPRSTWLGLGHLSLGRAATANGIAFCYSQPSPPQSWLQERSLTLYFNMKREREGVSNVLFGVVFV